MPSELKLSGEVLVVYLRHGDREKLRTAWVIHRPEVRDLAGRAFLCGKCYYPKQDNWTHDLSCRIAIDDISHFMEIETAEQYGELQRRWVADNKKGFFRRILGGTARRTTT
jgi:hypothetical protein